MLNFPNNYLLLAQIRFQMTKDKSHNLN